MSYRMDVFQGEAFIDSIPIIYKESLDIMIKNYIKFYKDEWNFRLKIYEIEGLKKTLIDEYPRRSEIS